MKIIITQSFKKQLHKLKFDEKILIKEISKYSKGISYINMWEWNWFCLYKDYLDSKRKRLLTLVKKWKYYFPVVILKKESKKGYNIHSNSVLKVFEKNFYDVLDDFEEGRIYKIIEI